MYIIFINKKKRGIMTNEMIKNECIENGVEEWFFDEIEDLSSYTAQEIIDLWNETQK